MTSFPVSIQNFLYDKDVDLHTIDSLYGVNSGRGVFAFRVYSKKNSFIVKKCIQKREFDVYTKHSAFFKEHNINIPDIFVSYTENGDHWIVIEDIPNKFPESRWKADFEQIRFLYQLHSKSLDKSIDLDDPFVYMYKEETIQKANKILPLELSIRLNALQTQFQQLFEPFCIISGDPNPTNWGIKVNGDLVLFDFERIGFGNPAIDLAITIPGVGSKDGSLEKEIAVSYITLWQENGLKYPFSVNELIVQIHRAKLWITLDFLTNNYETLSKRSLDYFVAGVIEKMKRFIDIIG
ncbi:phosphotransferase family protein [Fictibacillus sp. NRS-1165]|uniref:phosphotransferase family protein n=1 Tax=Fictibacillus sp. NRS-1165 TaxID=3144463 RepID=UPI003D1E61AE